MVKTLSKLNGEVFITLGDNCYPAKVRVFLENGKKIPYITLDMSKIDHHRNFPEKYGCKEVTDEI